MLSFHLEASEETPCWKVTNGGWTAGLSRVEPFRHRALEDFALITGDRLVVVVRERCAGEPRPELMNSVSCGGLTVVAREVSDSILAGMR